MQRGSEALLVGRAFRHLPRIIPSVIKPMLEAPPLDEVESRGAGPRVQPCSAARALMLVVLTLTACENASPSRASAAPASARTASLRSARLNLEDGLTVQRPNRNVDFPETMDMRQAVSGIVGPRNRWIVAVPLNGGGSGGAFWIAIFAIKDHGLHFVQEIQTDYGGVRALSISHGLLMAKNSRYLRHEPHCCPAATNTLIFGDPHGYVELLRSWWTR